jgi:hypothetical protein
MTLRFVNFKTLLFSLFYFCKYTVIMLLLNEILFNFIVVIWHKVSLLKLLAGYLNQFAVNFFVYFFIWLLIRVISFLKLFILKVITTLIIVLNLFFVSFYSVVQSVFSISYVIRLINIFFLRQVKFHGRGVSDYFFVDLVDINFYLKNAVINYRVLLNFFLSSYLKFIFFYIISLFYNLLVYFINSLNFVLIFFKFVLKSFINFFFLVFFNTKYSLFYACNFLVKRFYSFVYLCFTKRVYFGFFLNLLFLLPSKAFFYKSFFFIKYFF